VPFIGPEVRERRWSGSNRWWFGGASRHDGFGFDSTPRGRGNEGAEPREVVERRRRPSGVRSHAKEVARGCTAQRQWPNGWWRHDHWEEEDDSLVALCGLCG
jgi:hypothetical protein